MYRTKHYYFRKDLVNDVICRATEYSSRDATFIPQEQLYQILDKMFIKILPKIVEVFDQFKLNEQIIILSAYQKLDIFDKNLFEIFTSQITKDLENKEK